MVRGDVFRDPRTGSILEIGETAAETGGRGSMIRTIPPRSLRPVVHSHFDFHQTFTVRRGRIRIALDGDVRVLEAGESVHVPMGVAHTDPVNPFDEIAVFELAVWPHRPFHEYFAGSLAALHLQSRLDRRADWPPLAILAVFARTRPRTRIRGLPRPIQPVVLPVAAWLARRRGYPLVDGIRPPGAGQTAAPTAPSAPAGRS